MNSYRQLCLEYDGIFGTIKEYTTDINIINQLSILRQGLDSGDFETIQYSLQNLNSWYEKNLMKIRSNPYVHNFDFLVRNSELLKKIASELTEDQCVPTQGNQNPKENSPLIFLSHKSSDKKYGDALRDFIIGLGVKDNQLIYSSHPLNKIPMDRNIYEYLRENIHADIFMIILWSDEYLESPACLNEMGAAWVTQSDYTNIYVPTFSFGNPKYHQCAVDTRKMGAVLNGDANCKASLIELKNKIQNMFNLSDDEQKSAYLIDEMMKKIQETEGWKN